MLKDEIFDDMFLRDTKFEKILHIYPAVFIINDMYVIY